MSQTYEEFLFSEQFRLILQNCFPTNDEIDILEAEKLNFGLSNVIFKVVIKNNFATRSKKTNLIVKFYLASNSSISMSKEYFILEFLYENHIYVPKPYIKQQVESFEFVIMEYISDQSMNSILDRTVPENRITYFVNMIDIINKLHHIPLSEIKQQIVLKNIHLEDADQFNSYLRSFKNLIEKSGFTEFNSLYKWLDSKKPDRNDPIDALVHNDFHPFNMLLKDEHFLYVIDWEGISFGNSLIDVSWFIFVTSGICGKDTETILLSKYNEISNKNFTMTDLEYYMILTAAFRLVVFTVILNDIQGIRESDATYKMRILQNYKLTIGYILMRIKEITNFRFPSLEKYIFD